MLTIYVSAKASKRKVLWAKIHKIFLLYKFVLHKVCVTQSFVNYKTLITKYISNIFRKIEVAFSCFGKTPNLMSIYSRMTKKLKKNVVIKKSCTFAAENEYYLFT